MQTAIIIGATGLVGSSLLKQLLLNDDFDKIKIFVRSSTNIVHQKLQEHIIDFDEPGIWSNLVTGNILYSCLGTTLKKAGSKQAQYKIDYTYQYQFAEIAAQNGVAVYVLVSSIGAGKDSSFFYLKIKTELENTISKLPFKQIHILRPASLKGERKEKRSGETIGIALLNFMNSIGLFKKYQPIEADKVAKVMMNLSMSHNEQAPICIYESSQILQLSK